MESNAEPWFPDARVKTCVAILRRCSDASLRMNTVVKFVQFKQSLADIIGVPPGGENEADRQEAVQRLRDVIHKRLEDVEMVRAHRVYPHPRRIRPTAYRVNRATKCCSGDAAMSCAVNEIGTSWADAGEPINASSKTLNSRASLPRAIKVTESVASPHWRIPVVQRD